MAAALQMSWQQSLVHQKRKNGLIPPLGLRNLGNSCYLNSVLQCLTYTPPLANFCLSKNHSSSCDFAAEPKQDCPFCILEKRIARSLGTELTLDTPAKMNNCLRLFAENFRIGRQEDAHEFLRYVIDACHNTCLRLKKLQQLQHRRNGGGGNEGCGGDGTVVKEIFGGTLQSQVKCLSCGVESNKIDEIMDMSLDVLNSSSLKESLQKFFQAETLDGNNKYKCENCEKLVAARKQMSLLQAPNILVIQLKRFEGILGGKIDKTISFEEVLVLSSYMCKASKEKHAEYNLFGTIVHSGFSPDSGHYYAYVKDAMDRWYCCNDTYVKLSNLQEVLSEKVYILFFSRTKQRPGPAKAALASNGVKSENCNGSNISRSQNGVYSAKPVYMKPSVDRSVEKENLINGVKSEDCNGSKISRSQNGVYSEKPVYTKPSVDRSVEKENLINGVNSEDCNGNKISRSQNGVYSAKPVYSKPSVDRSVEKENLSNGVKSEDSNGSKISRSQNGLYSAKPVCVKSSVDRSIEKENLSKSQDNKVPSSAQDNLSSVGNSSSKKFPPSVDVKVVQKIQSSGRDGHVKASISMENGEPNMLSSNGNGATKSKTVDAIDSGNRHMYTLANGNGKIKITPANSVEAGKPEDNIGRNAMAAEIVANKHEMKNGNVNGPSNISGSKRKLPDEDSCILFAKDGENQAELEDFKEALQKEASSFLRSCGWTEEVHRLMCSKKACLQEAGNMTSNNSDLKKLLIMEAKRKFLSHIPESLKENLVKRLKTVSQDK